jgi:hypothetical protein
VSVMGSDYRGSSSLGTIAAATLIRVNVYRKGLPKILADPIWQVGGGGSTLSFPRKPMRNQNMQFV